MLKTKEVNPELPNSIIPFSIASAAFISGVCVVGTACKSVLLAISSQVHSQRHHAGSLRSACVQVMTLWKSADTTNQGFSTLCLPAWSCFLEREFFNHLPALPCRFPNVNNTRKAGKRASTVTQGQWEDPGWQNPVRGNLATHTKIRVWHYAQHFSFWESIL